LFAKHTLLVRLFDTNINYVIVTLFAFTVCW